MFVCLWLLRLCMCICSWLRMFLCSSNLDDVTTFVVVSISARRSKGSNKIKTKVEDKSWIHVYGAYSSDRALRRPTPRNHHFRKSQRTLLHTKSVDLSGPSGCLNLGGFIACTTTPPCVAVSGGERRWWAGRSSVLYCRIRLSEPLVCALHFDRECRHAVRTRS